MKKKSELLSRIRCNPGLVHVLPSLGSCICASSEFYIAPVIIVIFRTYIAHIHSRTRLSSLSHTHLLYNPDPHHHLCLRARDLSLLESIFRKCIRLILPRMRRFNSERQDTRIASSQISLASLILINVYRSIFRGCHNRNDTLCMRKGIPGMQMHSRSTHRDEETLV